MSDEEINKRVAEIEGWRLFDGVWAHADHCPFTYPHPPHYATDWAWCGPLIEKYCSEIEELWPFSDERRRWRAEVIIPHKQATAEADSPQRAICLALIAAHKKP